MFSCKVEKLQSEKSIPNKLKLIKHELYISIMKMAIKVAKKLFNWTFLLM